MAKQAPSLTPKNTPLPHCYPFHLPCATRCTGSTFHNGSQLCLLMYKCLHGLAPDYLTRLCVRVAMVHGRPRLRSSDDHQLLIPRTCTVTLGPCAFNTSGPASWNALPAALCDPAVTFGTFRQMLKSFLF